MSRPPLGYDSERRRHAAGRQGSEVADRTRSPIVETLLDAFRSTAVTVSMTINSPGPRIPVAFILARARRPRWNRFENNWAQAPAERRAQKIRRAARNYICPAAGPSMRLVTDVMALLRRGTCRTWNTNLERLRLPHSRRAGFDRAPRGRLHPCQCQSVPARSGGPSGLSIDTVAPRISFFWNAHNDFFEENCEVPRRAERCGPRSSATSSARPDPRSQMLRFHTQTGGSTLEPRRSRRTTSCG